MIILGHKDIEFKPFYFVKSSDDIVDTISNSTVIFELKDKVSLCKYCQSNGINFALIIDKIDDIYIGSSLGASYIVCDKSIALVAQKFADDYVIDAKILLYSSLKEDLVWTATNVIDGILLEDGIKYR